MKRIVTLLFVVACSLSFAKTIPFFRDAVQKHVLPPGTNLSSIDKRYSRSTIAFSSPVPYAYKLDIQRRYIEEILNSQSLSIPVPKGAFDAEEGLADPVLDLEAFSIVGSGTYVVIKTKQGEIPGKLPTVKTFKGKLRGMPNSLAVLAIEPYGNVTGFIRTANNTYTIGSFHTEREAAFVTKTDDIPYGADLARCAMTNEAAYDRSVHRPKQQGNTPLVATQTMKIAIDVDKAANDYFGSPGDATNWVTARFAAISAVYEEEIDVGIELGRIYIYTAPDPYSATTLDGPQGLLQKFTKHWATNNNSVDRTIAHLVSKQDLDNPGGAMGLAWLGVLCEKSNGYGVSRVMGSEQFPSIDESVTAHEIGHNVGSYHTHNCSQYVPPIDSCFPAEGGCFAGTKQIKGTIMSYCNQKFFNFHPRTIAVMKEAVANAPCLGTLAQIQVKTDSLIFPPIGLNQTKDTTLTALIKNTGSVPLTITSISIDNVEVDSEFYLKSLPAFPKILQPNQTQNVTVAFHPAYGGERFGELKITHNASGAMSIVGLRGIGAEPDPNFSILELDFGEVYVNGTYDSTIEYVENLGDAPLIISKTEITGVSASEFSIVSGQAPPNISVAPDKTASMKVRLNAKSLGPKDATVWIYHNAYTDPEWFDLYAIVVEQLSVRPGSSSAPSLIVSPNPARDKFSIDITSVEPGVACNVALVDQLGRTVATIADEKLAVSELHKIWKIDPTIADGTYLLVAKVGGMTLSERVVVLR